MAPSTEDRSIVTLGRDILAGVVAGYKQRGLTLPDRQYLTLGTPVNDCEQLVVSWQQAYLGTPGDEASLPQRCEAVKTAVFTVQICRKMPVVSESGHILGVVTVDAPTRDILLAQLAGAFGAPATQVVGLLSANLRNLAHALAQLQEQKERAAA